MFITEATSAKAALWFLTFSYTRSRPCEQQTLRLVTTQCALAAFNQPAQKSLVLHSAEKLCSKSGKLKGRSRNYVTHWTSNIGDRTLRLVILNSVQIQCYALLWTGKMLLKFKNNCVKLLTKWLDNFNRWHKPTVSTLDRLWQHRKEDKKHM